MKKYLYMVMTFIALQATAEAALPPLYQTSAEIKAIMSDHRLGDKLQSGEPIINIEKIAQGYLITTNRSQLQVKVIYEPSERPGPSQYRLDFGDPTPL